MKRALFAAAACLLSMAAFAAAPPWSPPVTILGYYIWDDGAAHLKTSNNLNPDNCTSAHYLTLDTTRSNFKAIWAQVIAAQASGQTVSLYYDGCIGPHPRIRAISVPDGW